MTESKRFTMCHQQNDKYGWTMSIVDWETDQPFDYTQYEVHSSSITDTKDEMEDLCLLLNQMNNEIEELKDALNQRTKQCDKYYDENEQLKQELNKIKRQEQEVCEYLQAYHKGNVENIKR